jgi:hypothetical protein
MVIHNEQYASKLKIWKTIGVVGITTICVYIPLSATFLREFGIEINPLNALQCTLFIFIALGIYASIIYLRHKQRLNFIYISDEDKQNLVFRFYHIQLLMQKCNTYKIPFDAFKKYEIVKNNKDTDLILYQKMGNNQMAKYPAISLNALKEDDIQQIKDLLNQYAK